MKHSLSLKEYICVASMLFGMFFGAGNLIFPVYMGQEAGRNVWSAVTGFLITGVGLPLFGVAALGLSRSTGLYNMTSKISRPFGLFFTCALYLTIGPFFAIPRCATTSFTVGIERVLPPGHGRLSLFLFSAIFFALALYFSLYPGKILVWIGKVLNPCFLLFLGILIVIAALSPSAHIADIEPIGTYTDEPFFTGFLEGYNTMDALAGLAFGIVVVHVIKDLGIEEPGAVAENTVKAGVFSCAIMAVIYIAVTVMGTQSRGVLEAADNGGIALYEIAMYYLGDTGALILAATVTLACLKTAVGLITSCSETFSAIFTKGNSYRGWAVLFSIVSLLFANLGLNSIISYSIPVLMFLYPLAIVIIVTTLISGFYENDMRVPACTVLFTLFASVYELICNLPENLREMLRLGGLTEAIGGILPFSDMGLGWICPAVLGFAIGISVHFIKKSHIRNLAA